MGVMIGTYLALDKMSKSKGGRGGHIINVASVAGNIYTFRDTNDKTLLRPSSRLDCRYRTLLRGQARRRGLDHEPGSRRNHSKVIH